MSRSFLGKPIPESTAHRHSQRTLHSRRGVLLMLLPFIAFSLFITLQQPGASSSTQTSSIRSAGAAVTTSRVLAQAEATPTCNDTYFKNAVVDSKGNVISSKIWPFIPKEFRTNYTMPIKNDKGEVIGSTPHKGCGPAYWSRTAVALLLYKLLVVFNWVAGALCIILTVYAGALYISGFAQESNIKQAKSILIGAYVGLLIVLFARLLVYGSIDILSSNKAEEAITNIPFSLDPSESPNP